MLRLLAVMLPLVASSAIAEPLRVAIVSRTVFYVPLWIAQANGHLRSEGLDTTIEVYNNAEKINEDLRSGKVQVAIGRGDRASGGNEVI